MEENVHNKNMPPELSIVQPSGQDANLYKNPYTHTLNLDEIKTIEDVRVIFNALDINIDPAKWEGDSKYIRKKDEG